MSLSQKEVRELLGHIRATKTHKVVSSGKHHRVLDLKGRVVVDENGPVIISKTPSEHRWREMTVHRLIKAGVFKSDPYKEHNKKKEAGDPGEHLTKEETRALQREGVARAARSRADRTKRLREKLEPLVARCGGWNDRRGATVSGVSPAELGMAAHKWGEDRGRVDRPPTVGAAQQAANANLKKGGTLSDRTADFWEAFVNEWGAADDPRRWYIDQVRAAKGLPPTVVRESTLEPASVPEGPVAERTSSLASVVESAMAVAATRLPTGVGHRALKAVFLMASGNDDADQNEIIEMGEWILAQEYKESGE